MTQLVNEKLILQLAKREKVEPTEAQINKKVEMAKKEGSLSQLLKQRGMTLDDYKRELTLNQAFINVVTKDIKVTDAELKRVYESGLQAKQSPFKKPERVEVALIVCKTKAGIDEASGHAQNAARISRPLLCGSRRTPTPSTRAAWPVLWRRMTRAYRRSSGRGPLARS